MSTKQAGPALRIKQPGSPKLTKQLNDQTTINKPFVTKPISTPTITSIHEVKIDKTIDPSLKQHSNNCFELYVSKEKMTLRDDDLQKIRQLQDANDQLQRKVAIQRKELLLVEDSLKLSAEIEQSMYIIARNAGEVLSIYSDNALRLHRISELENKNVNLQQDMSDVLGKIATCYDMHQKTKLAKEYFLKKAEHVRNTDEIQRLK